MPKPPLSRCPWCPEDDPLYVEYHDREWGVPVQDGSQLFAMLNLEGAQAGLSWRTILHKRARYYEVFEGFDPGKLAAWSEERAESLLQDAGIVRNRLKVHGVVRNARALQQEFGGDLQAFSEFLWSFPGWPPAQNEFRVLADFPSRTETSDRMSKELRKRGFTFVGSTICYAFMQAVGMVNDHAMTCFRREPVRLLGVRK